ncbi:thioredoxin family protein [Candidatus Neptunochlamydia vexilliferae]|nr:thioredoxin family protein [Candidatus Neptunochlamydia vexilliferae]
MVLTPSKMVPLGRSAPYFHLLDPRSGKKVSLEEIRSDIATVVMFICNHCPYVKHLQEMLIALARDYIPKGISFVAINSNDVTAYSEDGPEEMEKLAEKLDFPFPYLFDETQEVARAYQATCTPDFFVFDGKLKCAYRGQFDDSRPGNRNPVTGKDLAEALDCLLMGNPVTPDQQPSMGCNIKWILAVN